ncbi:hypothetical protein [Sphingomonas solaris]|uniref:Outer membrane protein beta-barrel domain-containing protein n=1 Tax=Alterirhizorhabdus solaris TaxID=2529389 RepID=A0A558R6Q8_9SPHN|nr:hypothetical protein [Sphingomonas solaris]TVV75002.1 hypothetical protein FOY91_08475 [Sphingomonas solaris]
MTNTRTMRHGSLLLAALLTAGTAPAQTANSHFYAGVTGGTLGIGPEVGYRVSDSFGVRGNATFLNLSHSFDSGNLDYRGKAKLKSGGVMLDAYPFANGFRISAGARLNGNNGRVRAQSSRSVTIGNTTYTPAQIGTIRGDAETKNVAPALTLGWAGQNAQGFVFGVEGGALFQGKVRVRNFRASTNLISAADLERERRDLQDDVDDYKVYPILQLTAGYRF